MFDSIIYTNRQAAEHQRPWSVPNYTAW